MKTTVTHKSPVFFRGEYVAGVDPGKCSACRAVRQDLSVQGVPGRARRKIRPRSTSASVTGCGVCAASRPRRDRSRRPRRRPPRGLALALSRSQAAVRRFSKPALFLYDIEMTLWRRRAVPEKGRTRFVTGAADDDPSGIATYSIAGAQYGYKMSWMSLFLIPRWWRSRRCAAGSAW